MSISTISFNLIEIFFFIVLLPSVGDMRTITLSIVNCVDHFKIVDFNVVFITVVKSCVFEPQQVETEGKVRFVSAEISACRGYRSTPAGVP